MSAPPDTRPDALPRPNYLLLALRRSRALPRALWRFARRCPRWLWYLTRDLVYGFARSCGWVYAWAHLTEERQAARLMESRDQRAKHLTAVRESARWRWVTIAVLGALALVAVLVGAYGFAGAYRQWLALAGLALLGFFEWVGHLPREDSGGPVRRVGALSHGTSTRTLRRDLEEAFEVKKILDVGVIGLTVNKYGWSGVFETESKISDELVEHVERWVHAPRGSILISTDARNSAAHPFTLLIDDPLAQPTTPPDPGAARTRDIRSMATLGRHLFGRALLVNLRTHIGLIGKTRSGKSSGLWVLIDWITSCSNARLAGIDLSNGPALPIWRRCIERRAHTPGDAAALLDWAIEMAISRNAILAERAEDDSSSADADLDENWNPTAADPAWFIAIDEFHILADDKDLLDRVKLLIRIGGKACVFLILATPKASKEDLGSVVIRAMIGLKILFSCEVGDITAFLGGGMVDSGWHPHRLKPAAGGQPNDAGKAYISDGDHSDPELVRISRLSANECRARARARSGPVVDLTKRARPAESPAPAEASRDAEPAVESTTGPELPESLQGVLDAFAEIDLPAAPTAWIMRFLIERDEKWAKIGPGGLALALKSHGVTTGRKLSASPNYRGRPNGYVRADVEAAAAAWKDTNN